MGIYSSGEKQTIQAKPHCLTEVGERERERVVKCLTKVGENKEREMPKEKLTFLGFIKPALAIGTQWLLEWGQ